MDPAWTTRTPVPFSANHQQPPVVPLRRRFAPSGLPGARSAEGKPEGAWHWSPPGVAVSGSAPNRVAPGCGFRDREMRPGLCGARGEPGLAPRLNGPGSAGYARLAERALAVAAWRCVGGRRIGYRPGALERVPSARRLPDRPGNAAQVGLPLARHTIGRRSGRSSVPDGG